MFSYTLDHLRDLEAESIFVLREVAAQFERPVLLFSGGKDSVVVSYLAYKAFYPAPVPFPLLHIDTGHNFPETLTFRDAWVRKMNLRLMIRYVQDSIDQGKVSEEEGPFASRNVLQTITLLDALREWKADAAIGGARRDEEKARAKERFFSHRDEFGRWEPHRQRPEVWSLFNGFHHPGEHFRVFPLSNWTERNIWEYIRIENIPVPSLYFSHEREVFRKDNQWYAVSEYLQPTADIPRARMRVRFRTVGDMTCTGAMESTAVNLDELIAENDRSRFSERGTRIDDQRSETAMEDRKRSGYF